MYRQNMTDKTEVSTLSERRTKGSDGIFEMFCETCRRDGKHSTACGFCTSCVAYLCPTCLNYHGKFLPDHTYLDGENLPQDVCTEKCSFHNTEIIKFYCKTCDKFACSVCKRLDHKKVCAMKYLPDIVHDLERGEELKQLILNSSGIAERLSNTERTMYAQHEYTQEIYSDVKIAIKKEKEFLFGGFDHEADDIEKEVRSIESTDSLRLGNVKEMTDTLNKEISKLVSNIQQLPTSPMSRKYKLFIDMKRLNQRLQYVGNVVEDLAKHNSTSNSVFKNKLTKKATDLTRRVNEFGSYAKDTNVKVKDSAEKDGRKIARPLGEVNVNSARDTDDCHIVDCCLLSEQYLIACDKNNSSVKLIDTKGQGVIYVRHIKTVPEAVTKITDSKFAMVHPYDNDGDRSIIQFITMTESRTLNFLTHFILTEMYCVNIVYTSDDKLIISMWANHEGKVQILSMTGKVLVNIENNAAGDKLFRCPEYITLDATGVRLYVSDWYRDSVTEINLHDKSIRELGHRFWHPEGITTDGEGFVYICESGTGRVHVFHRDESDTHVLLEKHSSDWRSLSICFSVTDNKLYVCQKGQNSIKVYEITDSMFIKNKLN